MKTKAAKLIRTVLLFACGIVLLALLTDRCTVEVPTTQRIADFTADDLSIEFRPELHSPYHLVIGVPGTTDTPPNFRGIVEVRSPDGTTQTVAIASDTVTHCNWLRDTSISGFVLAWTAPQQFSTLLRRGTTYQLRLSFTEPLPAGCSLWFASMKHVSIILNRNA